MKHTIRKSLLILGLSFAGANLTLAQGSNQLVELLQKIENNQTEEAERNQAREQRFQSETDLQESMLQDALAEVERQENLRDSLKDQFDSNEVSLGELETNLDRRVGDLGELFGVFRQMADDTQTMLFDSLITLEHPERKGDVSVLAESTEVPTIPQMRSLWELLIQETALSGQVSRFTSDIITPGGEQYAGTVTRVGTFNIVSDDLYLNYLSDSDQLTELPRQPQSYVRNSAGNLSDAGSQEEVGFYIDPSRGALLGLLVQSPSLMERVEQGKGVGYAIIFVGVIGMLVVLERFLKLFRIQSRMKKQQKDLDHPNLNNPIGRILNIYYENKHLDLESIKHRLEEMVFRDISDVKKGLPVIKVLSAVAPLMGLLGTVTGMIGTFQAITLFGTGDPKLMAGGISQALITTVLGLLVAIPMLLTHSLLSSRVTAISKMIGEQAASLLADKAETNAKLRG